MPSVTRCVAPDHCGLTDNLLRTGTINVMLEKLAKSA